jgi:hypothetical protein
MRKKQNRYIADAVKRMIKIRDLKPTKDAKGGLAPPCLPPPCGAGKYGSRPAGFHDGTN